MVNCQHNPVDTAADELAGLVFVAGFGKHEERRIFGCRRRRTDRSNYFLEAHRSKFNCKNYEFDPLRVRKHHRIFS